MKHGVARLLFCSPNDLPCLATQLSYREAIFHPCHQHVKMSMHRDDGTNLIDFLQGSFLNNEVVDVGLLSFYELVIKFGCR